MIVGVFALTLLNTAIAVAYTCPDPNAEVAGETRSGDTTTVLCRCKPGYKVSGGVCVAMSAEELKAKVSSDLARIQAYRDRLSDYSELLERWAALSKSQRAKTEWASAYAILNAWALGSSVKAALTAPQALRAELYTTRFGMLTPQLSQALQPIRDYDQLRYTVTGIKVLQGILVAVNQSPPDRTDQYASAALGIGVLPFRSLRR